MRGRRRKMKRTAHEILTTIDSDVILRVVEAAKRNPGTQPVMWIMNKKVAEVRIRA